MLQRIISRLGHDNVGVGDAVERTMGFGNTIMLWLAANMVVTTLLTGTLFIPGVPYFAPSPSNSRNEIDKGEPHVGVERSRSLA